jgi:hypothetical protein
MNGGGPCLNWAALVPQTIHPVQVAIIEAMEWVGEPLSATLLQEMFDDPERCYLSILSYHMGKLARWRAVEPIRHRHVRGARETFYFLAPGMSLRARV